jgi:hypothetical protein
MIIDPNAEALWNRISDYWVGDIKEFADTNVFSHGIEQGIQHLSEAL